MRILGLTGSIGMGKTTAAGMLRRLGVPVHDADATVHGLMASGGAAVPAIAEAFPKAVSGDAVDRQGLGALVFDDPPALRRLEAILHPMVRADAAAFVKRARRRRCPLVCLDIPLLFETAAEGRCDAVLVVTAPRLIQASRVLRRPGMIAARFEAILAAQMPDGEKRRRADFVVTSGLGKRETLRRLAAIVRLLRRPDATPIRRGRGHRGGIRQRRRHA